MPKKSRLVARAYYSATSRNDKIIKNTIQGAGSPGVALLAVHEDLAVILFNKTEKKQTRFTASPLGHARSISFPTAFKVKVG